VSDEGKEIIEGLTEAVEIAQGNQPAPRLHVQGHAYVPEERLSAAERQLADLRVSVEARTDERDAVSLLARNRGRQLAEARAALLLVDEDVRHHHRSDSDSAALLRPHAIRAVRAVLAGAQIAVRKESEA
jgi:hypothetical protein